MNPYTSEVIGPIHKPAKGQRITQVQIRSRLILFDVNCQTLAVFTFERNYRNRRTHYRNWENDSARRIVRALNHYTQTGAVIASIGYEGTISYNVTRETLNP